MNLRLILNGVSSTDTWEPWQVGGFSNVYLNAEHTKVLKTYTSSDDELFIYEWVTTPPILELTPTSFEIDNVTTHAFVMNKCSDTNLSEVIENDWNSPIENQLSDQDLIEITALLLEKLYSQIHKYGVIHKDIKMENICIQKNQVTNQWIVDFIDFNLSHSIYSDQNKIKSGTLLQLSPEFIKGEVMSYKADVFCLGLVLSMLWRSQSLLRAFDVTDPIDSYNCCREFEDVQSQKGDEFNHALGELLQRMTNPVEERATLEETQRNFREIVRQYYPEITLPPFSLAQEEIQIKDKQVQACMELIYPYSLDAFTWDRANQIKRQRTEIEALREDPILLRAKYFSLFDKYVEENNIDLGEHRPEAFDHSWLKDYYDKHYSDYFSNWHKVITLTREKCAELWVNINEKLEDRNEKRSVPNWQNARTKSALITCKKQLKTMYKELVSPIDSGKYSLLGNSFFSSSLQNSDDKEPDNSFNPRSP